LVELVPGQQTAPETMERARHIYRALGKTPITLAKEVPGHIVNRLQAALWREAIDLAVQGVASIEDIDLAVSAGPGLRWALLGQHMIYHLNGGPGGMPYFLQLLQAGFESYWRDLATWTELTPEAAQVMIDGVQAEMGDRTYQELVAWRDEYLLKLVDLLGGGGAQGDRGDKVSTGYDLEPA
jgi:3-hydroxyacyl-CoA dehydrogenase